MNEKLCVKTHFVHENKTKLNCYWICFVGKQKMIIIIIWPFELSTNIKLLHSPPFICWFGDHLRRNKSTRHHSFWVFCRRICFAIEQTNIMKSYFIYIYSA